MRVTNLHSELTLGGIVLSPAAGSWDYDRDSMASPTMAVYGPFSSYCHDDRGQGHRYVSSIAAVHRHAKLCQFCSIATQHAVNGRKFTSWNYFDSNCVQTRFEIIFLPIFY